MFQIFSCKRLLEITSENIVKFHRGIQHCTWTKYYRLTNFENNHIKEKSPTLLILGEIEAPRGCKLQKKQQQQKHKKESKTRPHRDILIGVHT